MRKNARLWVALAGAMVIAGLFVGIGMLNASGKTHSARVGIAPLVAAGNHASSNATFKAAPTQRTQVALPGLTRPIRDLHVARGKHNVTREVSRGESVGASTGFNRTQGIQTKAGSGHMPAPIANFDGIARICGCLPPDTDGDVGPNYYMQYVNTDYAVYNKTTGAVVA